MRATRAISLEQYLDFLHSGGQARLTIGCLNQIVSMQGFRKISHGKSLKKLLVDAVKTIDLIDPARSTLKQFVSPNAALELDEVITDLNALGWRECCTTSLKTISKDKETDPPPKYGALELPRKALKWKGTKKRKVLGNPRGKGKDSGAIRLVGDQNKTPKMRMKKLKEITVTAATVAN